MRGRLLGERARPRAQTGSRSRARARGQSGSCHLAVVVAEEENGDGAAPGELGRPAAPPNSPMRRDGVSIGPTLDGPVGADAGGGGGGGGGGGVDGARNGVPDADTLLAAWGGAGTGRAVGVVSLEDLLEELLQVGMHTRAQTRAGRKTGAGARGARRVCFVKRRKKMERGGGEREGGREGGRVECGHISFLIPVKAGILLKG